MEGVGDGRVVLVGGGPSAARFPFRLYRDWFVVAINDSARMLPEADMLFSADMIWVQRRLDLIAEFRGRKLIAAPKDWKSPIPGLEVIERRLEVDLSTDPGYCYNGDNSGFCGLTAMIALGAKDIILTGFDLGDAGHWHGGYEWYSRKGVRDYPQWAENLERIAPGIERLGVRVRNANPDSAIRCFEFL